ncbi:MAG TPA: hypothetical protein PKY27_14060, partial [Arachnia sp.]|nr:hypothetical protein [Arachnia sp.]
MAHPLRRDRAGRLDALPQSRQRVPDVLSGGQPRSYGRQCLLRGLLGCTGLGQLRLHPLALALDGVLVLLLRRQRGSGLEKVVCQESRLRVEQLR